MAVREVVAPGTQVDLSQVKGAMLPAIITKACLSTDGVSYEVAWFDKNTRITAWVSEAEFWHLRDDKKRTIGFKAAPERADS